MCMQLLPQGTMTGLGGRKQKHVLFVCCLQASLEKAQARVQELEDDVSLLEERLGAANKTLDDTKYQLRVAQVCAIVHGTTLESALPGASKRSDA